jgi:hypothetical protein
MLKQQDREVFVEASRIIHKEMEREINNSNYLRADELGLLWDKFVHICGRLESKDEVL